VTIDSKPVIKGMTLWFIPPGSKAYRAGQVIDINEGVQCVKLQWSQPSGLKSTWYQAQLCRASEPRKDGK
jgi:hypothetical protein